LELKS